MSWTGKDSSFESVMLWAAALTTFFSVCMPGKIMVENEQRYDPSRHLSWWDVAADDALSPSIVSLNIKIPKTDQGRVGCQVVIGKTNDGLCSVTALLDYLDTCGNHPGALFQWQDKTPLSKHKFGETVRKALTAADLPAKEYAGHSFRIGAATTAAAVGLQDSAIQTLGRWRSDCYQLYIKSSPRHLAALSSSLSESSI